MMPKTFIKFLGIFLAGVFCFALAPVFSADAALPVITKIEPADGQKVGKFIGISGSGFYFNYKQDENDRYIESDKGAGKNIVVFIQGDTEEEQAAMTVNETGTLLRLPIPLGFKEGTVSIGVKTGGISSELKDYTIIKTPTREITKVIPTPLTAGVPDFTIKGKHFLQDDKVIFNGYFENKACPTDYKSDTELLAIICVNLNEAYAEGKREISIKVSGNLLEAHASLPRTIALSSPLSFDISSISDPAQPGTIIVIRGTNFNEKPENNLVKFIHDGYTIFEKEAEEVDPIKNKWIKVEVPTVDKVAKGYFDKPLDVQVETLVGSQWVLAPTTLPFTIKKPPTLTLSVTLTAEPASGSAPLMVSLTAEVKGTATGTINYLFDCGGGISSCPAAKIKDTDDTGTFKEGWCHFDNRKEQKLTVENLCEYTAGRTYTALVKVERGSAEPTSGEAEIKVTKEEVPALPGVPTFKISPDDFPKITVGTSYRFKAFYDEEDVTLRADWESLNLSIAPVDNDEVKGLVYCLKKGQVKIRATYSGITAENWVKCTSEEVAPTKPPAEKEKPAPGWGLVCPSKAKQCKNCIQNPLCAESFDQLINAIINFVLWLAVAIAPIMFLIGGFYLITAGGDPKRVTTAKTIMIYTAIGLAVILFARGLIAVIQNVLGVK